MHLIAPSILSADFGNLEAEIKMINNSNADWFHVDVMDGVFVPNISFGFPIMKVLKNHATKPLDVHLMIVEPDRYIKNFAVAGASTLTVHYEACTHLHRTLQAIKNEGMHAGVALNPHTPVNVLEDILHDIDLVCIMSVNPGFGGQHFIEHTLQKVANLNNMIKKQQLATKIEIDGGVTLQNYKALIAAGATVLVAGNTVFASPDPKNTIEQLKNI
ncbi:MAG: hypothetical protein RIQ89_2156 [Bacteroidota bacterium]|jgi:ribulose-phosphate 3-epimerase